MLSNPHDVHALSRIAAGGLLNSLVAGIAVAALAYLLARVAGRDSSRTRFAVWFVALIVIALFPWVGPFSTSSRLAAPAPATGAVTLPESFAFYISVVWIIGAALGLAHVAHGLYRLLRLKGTCIPVDRDQLDPILCSSLDEIQSHRRVALCVSDTVRVPAAVGYFRPIVVFPLWALAEIPPAELNAILLHELAHLRRYDDWTNLGQKLVKAVLFFHPVIWFIESRLTLEREMACDDAVLAASFSPRAYAESLVSLAEKSFLRRGVQLAQAAVGHVKQLRLRLVEILRKDKHRQGSVRLGKSAVAMMSLAGIIATYGICHAPQLIAFSTDAPPIVSASSASHTISDAAEFHLQPVNLAYNARRQPNQLVGQTEPTVSRARRHTAHAAIASQVSSGATPSPMFVFSKLPTGPIYAPVLVVFQGKQFGADGPIFWQVTVLRFTPSQRRIVTVGVPKKI